MATINRFEDLEIWQLAFNQSKDFDLLVETTPLAKDYELRNQMKSEFKGQRYKKEETSTEPQTSNFKPETK